jgi:hypothetical protein
VVIASIAFILASSASIAHGPSVAAGAVYAQNTHALLLLLDTSAMQSALLAPTQSVSVAKASSLQASAVPEVTRLIGDQVSEAETVQNSVVAAVKRRARSIQVPTNEESILD